MKATHVKISLDKRRSLADGTYPIILRLTHKGQSTSIKTGIYVQEKDWDEKACQVKSTYQGTSNVKRLNNELQKRKAEALDKVLKIADEVRGKRRSLVEVRHEIKPEHSSNSFYDFAEKLTQNLTVSERIGTARSYKGVISVLKTFNKGKPVEKNSGGDPIKSSNSRFKSKFKGIHYHDLAFDEIDYSFLKKFENYHLAAGNDVNGLAVYMRTIRAIYNQGIKAGKVEKSLYPFDEYKIRTQPTKKRSLDQKYLKNIISLELPEEHSSFHARNYFLASYYMYGMNFADMARLQKSDISNGRIQYRRSKTKKLYDIKITENLNTILSYYLQQNKNSPYVFPIIKRETAALQEKDIQWMRKKFNENLKEIAALSGVEQKLTSYVSRHSFATHAMLNNIPVNAISSMLGHSSLKTTEIYLKSLPSNILDDYNERILKL
jgi:integrase/recombinase XerD